MQSKTISFQCGRLAPLALGLAVLPVFGQSGAGQSALAREHFQAVRERYQQESWPESAPRDGLSISMRLEGWRAGPLQAEQGLLSRSFTAAASSTGAPSFIVESMVRDSAEEAHEELVTWLAGIQSPRTMPTARAFGFEVGDVAFVGPSGAGPKAISWIGFTRANVAVRVMAFDPRANPSLDLASVARAIDARIVAREPLPAGATVPRPRILELAAPTYTAVAGNELRLDASVADTRGGEPHLRWSVGGTGQGYVERGADGAWYLHTTGPGSIELGLEVTASTGTVAARSIEIQVADD